MTAPPAARHRSTPTNCDLAHDATILGGAYRLFRDDPQHPSLRFKKVHDREPIYSVRVTGAYRAVDIVQEDDITWFWTALMQAATAF